MRSKFPFNGSIVLRTHLLVEGDLVGLPLRADLYAVDELGIYYVVNFIVRCICRYPHGLRRHAAAARRAGETTLTGGLGGRTPGGEEGVTAIRLSLPRAWLFIQTSDSFWYGSSESWIF